MKKLFILFTSLFLLSMQGMAQTGVTTLVSVGPDGKLKYTPDANGNIIPDFSAVGYKTGDVPIPTVPVVKTISAVSGDNTANIQNAINAVAAMPMDANGIRGALLLKAGTYNVNTTLTIKSGGVVLRGEGNGTILMATKTSQYDLLAISGSGGASAVTSSSKQIQGSYIPVGAQSFTLPAGHGFVAGDDVFLQRKPNQAWIHMLGMDVLSKIPCDDGGCNVDWTPAAYTVNFIRKVVAVNGNVVTLDAPNVDVIDSKYAQGFIMKYTWSGKIENVGVESIYFDSKYTNANDEQHGWNAITFSNAKNGWVTNVEGHHYGYSTVSVNESAGFISILNCKNIDPISQTIGGRKYSYNITGQRNLVKNCTSQGGRHDFVTGSQTAGPNVFTSSSATNQQADIGPHQRWATGILFDVLTSNSEMNAQNRLGYGTGHGWSGSQVVYWNCQATTYKVQSPPNHMNWVIGCKGTVTDVGDLFTGDPCIHESTNNKIGAIPSLYEKQLADRLSGTTPVTPVPDNLAKGKPVKVSSTEASTTTSTIASNATDGDYSTRWSSLFADPQWLTVDLGANYNVNRVKLSWETAYATAYQIQISSDSTNWTNLKSVTGNTTTTNDQTGLSGTGRYVRIYGTSRATAYGYSLYEVEVYGTATESPYSGTAINLPGKIEAENYDLGGEGLAYHDADVANQGSAYRTTDGVDVQATTDTGAGYNVGYITAGEWLKYMVNVTAAGNYDIAVRVAATAAGSTLHIELDGTNITGTINVPNTGAWQTWQTVTLTNVALTAGPKTMKIAMDGGSFNLNYVSFQSSVPTNKAPTVNLTAPVSGTTAIAPAAIIINADATDADGTISKVDFYNGTTLLGTSTVLPYSFTWNNVAAGTYTVTAKATDNSGAAVTSAAVTVTVTALPVCLPASASSDDGDVATNVLDNNLATRWSATGDGQWIQFCLGTAQDVSGVQVAFYNGNTRQSIFDVQVSQDGTSWTNVLTNVHSSGTSVNLETFTFATQNAKYVRLLGHGNTASAWNSYTEVKILTGTPPANQAPSAVITSPANNSSFNAPASIVIATTAADLDGTVSKVEFFNGTTSLGVDATSPYSLTWTSVAVGTYSVTAVATDNLGASTTSAAVSVVVVTAPVNVAPTVTLTAPANNASLTAPASIAITATASDLDGTVTKVDFYNGTTLLGTDATSPYSYTWTNVAAGTYTISAKATDNSGASTASTVATVKVTAPANTCSGIAAYKENNGYAAGSKVQEGGKQYQCKPYPYSGWCNGAAWAYAPGTGSYWTDAWTLIGSCTARSADDATTNAALLTNAPNPFSSSTTLTVVVTEAGEVSVLVYNKAGMLVRTITDGYMTAGSYDFAFDASQLPADMYIVKYNTSSGSITQKIMKTE